MKIVLSHQELKRLLMRHIQREMYSSAPIKEEEYKVMLMRKSSNSEEVGGVRITFATNRDEPLKPIEPPCNHSFYVNEDMVHCLKCGKVFFRTYDKPKGKA